MKFFLIPIVVCFISSLLLTPLVKRIAVKIGATDRPNERKVHTKIMPRLGGLAIFLSFMIGILLYFPSNSDAWFLIVGASVIVLTGVLDDIFCLPAKVKLIGQIIAATIPVI